MKTGSNITKWRLRRILLKKKTLGEMLPNEDYKICCQVITIWGTARRRVYRMLLKDDWIRCYQMKTEMRCWMGNETLCCENEAGYVAIIVIMMSTDEIAQYICHRTTFLYLHSLPLCHYFIIWNVSPTPQPLSTPCTPPPKKKNTWRYFTLMIK